MEEWTGTYVYPARNEEEWEKTLCGCPVCWDKQSYFHKEDAHNHWNKGSCRKIEAYEAQLETKVKQRFSPAVTMAGFKPASAAQIAEWTAWLSTPEAAKAHNKVVEMTETAMATWNNHKFNPVAMEHGLAGMWPAEKNKYMRSPMWVAYENYGKEQYELLNAYNKILTNGIKTKEDYIKADKLYKDLAAHINKHGRIITGALEKKHKLPEEKSTEAPKKGRRAMRAERNASDSSSSTVSRQEARAAKVVANQAYTASDE